MVDGKSELHREVIVYRSPWLEPGLLIGGGLLFLFVLAAVFAPFISPHDPLDQDLMANLLPPFWQDSYDPLYPLGTDSLGRDLLSRVLHGARIALTVAVLAALFAAVLGTILGLLAGYLGGWVNTLISRLVDIWMSFPAVLLSIVLVAALGTGLHSVIIAIGIIDWTRFCRVVRAETMVHREQDYVTAARALGVGDFSIIFKEILPNLIPALLTLFFLEMGIAVVVEAILSFVGLSLSSDTPTWGGLIDEGRQYIHDAWWVVLIPVLCILTLVIALNACGEGIRRGFDPMMRR
ncbi:MAG: ABC transporter permease, partial [Gammaproteobacteria bacterium]|nr:ABC transporter permease [Gammaproteobacteria bacterium]